MIIIKTPKEIEILREGGKRLATVLYKVEEMVRPGISTKDLDDYAFRLIKEMGDVPAFLHYRPDGADSPYPASICISVNNEVVHGIPKKDKILKEGDIVSLDLGLKHKNLFTDMLTSIAVLVGGIIMKYWGLYWVDSVVTILIALYLIKSSWGLMISSVKILLMFSPKELIIKDIANDLKTIEGVDCVYHVHVWQLNDDSIFFEARVIFSEDIPISSFQKKLKEMEKVLAKYGISHATLQPGYGDDSPRELINQE